MSRISEAAFGDTPYELPSPSKSRAFDGQTYSPQRDYIRLNGQLAKVFELMKDGRSRTLSEIQDQVCGSEAAVSARLRDLRKDKYGGHDVQRVNVSGGLFRYRLIVKVTP